MNEAIISTLIILLIAVALITAIIILAIKGKKDIIFKIIYALVNEAEELFGSGTGKRKFAYVMEQVYAKLPAIIRTFITYDVLEKWIEQALAEAKEYWAMKAEIADEDTVVSGFAQ